MQNREAVIALGIVSVFLFICSSLKPPKETCNIREAQAAIGATLILFGATYFVVCVMMGTA